MPLAFLGRTIKDLLATPFEELTATPGIGQKKITSLVKLLSRATKDHAAGGADRHERRGRRAASVSEKAGHASAFDPAIVSEALWSQWRETVKSHSVGREKLGRLAPTLQPCRPLSGTSRWIDYVDFTVGEIRQLRTHGEKRVRVVLEVFYIVHEILHNAATDNHLSVRLVPKFIEPLEQWVLSGWNSTVFLRPRKSPKIWPFRC